ncbi:MAG: 1-deoxy-D-xylulose-5-phosphate synthase, partial [Oscillospiraceae bacterium]|nr:1-deoxy-D-xylulose-5-phosphate synthase [Oscillospiraceae bacterium]
HLVVAIDRAGIVGDDGETHQGIYDIAFLTGIPGITIYSPASAEELEAALEKALYKDSGLVALRYPRGSDPGLYESADPSADYTFFPGSKKLTVVSYGRTFQQLWKAVSGLEECPSVLQLNKVWPFPEEMLEKLSGSSYILFFEEAEQTDSLSEHLLSVLYRRGWRGELQAVTLPDGFIPQAKPDSILAKYHLDAASMETRIREEMNRA